MKVTRFEKIEKFRDFSLIKRRGNHSVCSFSFISARFDDYIDMEGSCIEVSDNKGVLMHGIIDSVTFVSGHSENIVKVTLISKSCKLDINPIVRIFQKEGQTYKDILDVITQKNGYEINVPASLKEAELGHPIVQYKETDFIFIKRMLMEAYGEDIVTDVGEEKTFYVGYLENRKHEILMNEVYTFAQKTVNDMNEIEFAIHGGLEGQELRDYVDIGKLVTWKGVTYVITKLEIEKNEGVYRYKCIANYFCGEKNNENRRCNYCFTAKVTEVADPDNYGRVRLNFSDVNIEDMTSDGKVWINVLTPYTAKNGGFVFIPEVDDVVKAVWDGYEFVVLGCKRVEALAERYQNVQQKQIGNLYDRNICWDEEKLEISSKDAMVTLSDEEIFVSTGDSVVNFSKDKIAVKTQKSVVEINEDIIVATRIMHVDSDELEQKTKKNYVCESKNITLNASAAATIEGKTKVSIN